MRSICAVPGESPRTTGWNLADVLLADTTTWAIGHPEATALPRPRLTSLRSPGGPITSKRITHVLLLIVRCPATTSASVSPGESLHPFRQSRRESSHLCTRPAPNTDHDAPRAERRRVDGGRARRVTEQPSTRPRRHSAIGRPEPCPPMRTSVVRRSSSVASRSRSSRTSSMPATVPQSAR